MTSTRKGGAKAPPTAPTPSDPEGARLLPAWLPPDVHNWIAENWNHPEHVAGRAVIVALANDPLMKRLWEELGRKKPQGYVHEVNRAFLLRFFTVSPGAQARKAEAEAHLDDVELCRRVAYQFLFKWLLRVAYQPGAAATVKEATARVEEMRERAAFLRREADDTEWLGRSGSKPSHDWLAVAAGMRAKADFLEEAVEIIPVLHPILTNDRPNRRGIAAAIKITGIFDALFSKPFHKLSAELATLLTGEETTMEQVRAERTKQNPYVSFKSEIIEN